MLALGVVARASTNPTDGRPIRDPASASDLLATAATGRPRLDRATASATSHLSHATWLFVEELGADDRLSAGFVECLDPTTLFLLELGNCPLDRLLPFNRQRLVFLEQILKVVTINTHAVERCQRLLVLHLERLALAVHPDELQIFVIKLSVEVFDGFLQTVDSLFKRSGV